jgi:catechol 2,3-dioxygenase-like lactoylglutathione lyase family enzyme
MTTLNLSWGHININVSDLDTSIAFYEKLGFSLLIPGVPYLGIGKDSGTEIPPKQSKALDVPSGKTARACIMQLDDGFPKIDLTEYAKDSPQAPAVNDDLGIVEGVGELADIAICRDPDGTLIELIELHLEKWGTT